MYSSAFFMIIWLNGFHPSSIDYLMDFCEIFLNLWTIKKEFREEDITYLAQQIAGNERTSTNEGFDSATQERMVNKAYEEIQEGNISLMSPQERNQHFL